MSKAWLIRPYPHDISRINEFRQGGFVAIGWPGIGDLTGKSCEDIKRILAGKPYSLSGNALGCANATVDIFVNRIAPGDLILVPDGTDIFFAEICSDYYLDAAFDSAQTGYSHQRKVKWLRTMTRDDLSKALRSSLKVWRTAASLSKHYEEIYALAYGKEYSPSSAAESIAVSYPLRKDFSISFSIPADITKDEASRLAQYFGTLYFSE